MYVALTRARESSGGHLSAATSTRSRRGADYSIDQLSRFIDRGVRDDDAARGRRGARRRARRPSAPAGPAIDLRAIMRGRFGSDRETAGAPSALR